MYGFPFLGTGFVFSPLFFFVSFLKCESFFFLVSSMVSRSFAFLLWVFRLPAIRISFTGVSSRFPLLISRLAISEFLFLLQLVGHLAEFLFLFSSYFFPPPAGAHAKFKAVWACVLSSRLKGERVWNLRFCLAKNGSLKIL